MSRIRLEVKNLSFSYSRESEVLKDVSFSVGPGEILGILGPNGGGKSTLLKLIMGAIKPQRGEISFIDAEGKRISRPAMSYIPQREAINLSYPMTVEELLKSARLPLGRVSDDEVAKALERVSFTKDPKQKVATLSGGEFQRILLAKAYLYKASLILMDEPTKGLDGVGQDKLLKLVQEFKSENQAAILLVDHNIAQVLRHGDRLLCLNKTFHWHNHKAAIEKGVLEDTYHCEFEHLMIHELKGNILEHDHHHCGINHQNDNDYGNNHGNNYKEEEEEK